MTDIAILRDFKISAENESKGLLIIESQRTRLRYFCAVNTTAITPKPGFEHLILLLARSFPHALL